MKSFGDDELIFAYIGCMLFIFIIFFSLRAEISYEPHYVEMNVPLGKNFTYYTSIRNIGSDNVTLRYSAIGINSIAIGFNPESAQINPGNITPMNICIDTKESLPGDYQGFIYIRNNDNQQILEKIPLTIKVREVNRTSDSLEKVYVC